LDAFRDNHQQSDTEYHTFSVRNGARNTLLYGDLSCYRVGNTITYSIRYANYYTEWHTNSIDVRHLDTNAGADSLYYTESHRYAIRCSHGHTFEYDYQYAHSCLDAITNTNGYWDIHGYWDRHTLSDNHGLRHRLSSSNSLSLSHSLWNGRSY